MSSEDEIKESLDAEFDRFVVAMKPYVLNLQHSSDRKRCSLWIKKLCKPSGTGIGIVGRENRNLYAKLLLHMLQRGVLDGPFSQKPEEGMLRTLPAYMSVYFDEPISPRFRNSSADCLPEWVVGELGNHESNISSVEGSSSATPAHGERFSEKPSAVSCCLLSSHRTDEDDLGTSLSDDQHKRNFSLDDDDLEARLNSWNLGIENPRYLREKRVTWKTPKIDLGESSPSRENHELFRMQEKELEMKMKIAEGKFHEEKLKLQQKHDVDVQKILDRKNDEIDVLKSTYTEKQKEAEETIRKLEKKVQTLVRESQVVREAKEQQIVELKKLCEQSNDSLNNEWEKRLLDAVAEMEKEKFNIRKKHTEDMQELLEETNARLAKMEQEYLQQTQSTCSAVVLGEDTVLEASAIKDFIPQIKLSKNETVEKLGARVQQLTVEAENSNLQRQKLSQEKTEVEQRYQEVCSQLQDLKARYDLLQKDKDQITQEYKEKVQQLQSKFEVDRDFLKKEQAQQTSDVIAELQRGMALLKQQLQDCEHQRQQELRDQEYKVQQDKLQLQRAYEKQIHGIQNDLDKERGDAQKKIRHLEQALKEKEEQLRRVTEVQRLQAQQAGAALEEFKRQVELNSEKDSAEMKQRIAEVEADLSRSKLLREKQAQEFSWQLDEIKKRYEQQIVELKLEHEQEKTHLFQQHNAVQDCLVRDHQREIEKLEKQLCATMAEHESQAHESRKRDGQVISGLEIQIRKLREELIQANALRNHQLLDLSLQRDEEKLKAARDKEAALNSLKMEMEKVISDMKMKHTAETETVLNKANSQLRHTKEEFRQKLAKCSQEIAELRTTISSLTEKNSRQQLAAEQRLQEVAQKLEDEKQQLMTDNDRAIKALQDEVENYRGQVYDAQRRLQRNELKAQEQLITIREEYEKILKGLMPASSKKELEDIISSLKSQKLFGAFLFSVLGAERKQNVIIA
ncbi:centrosomal protein of 112 kDa isoform X1 [Cyanistes caeruleus]|uniref:centrosomal protein of 112 kDa isoform X1 n=1 Tax=Cyanistes caeruleus TaxID=156563 RepID=UPI000CDB09D2|nr:centrosomal protein of 112 kDa isoform X1 [Cyanistes caeruleus]XP_023794594.1 centrosomal protein of 112 kDa isoform X1 [Cyanistes caeruleus]